MKSFLPPSGSARRFLLVLAAGALSVAATANEIPDVRLAPLVTTATRTATDRTVLGSAVDVIYPEELTGRQLDAFAAALTGVPGAPLFASGAAGATTSLFLRGANSNQTLFLVDGLRLNDANTDYGVFLGGAALGHDVIEVVRGPQSTLYGSDAIGGVVAVSAERGEGAAQSRLNTEAGSFGTVRASFATVGAAGPWGYNLSLDAGHTNNARANNAFGTAGASARLDRRVSDSLEVGATARWFHSEYGDPGDRFTNDPDDSTRENNLLVTLFADARPAPGWSVHATAGGQDRRFVSDSSFGAAFPNSTAITTNRRGVLDAQATFAGWLHHRLTAGFTAETAQTRNTGFGSIDRRQTSLAFFAQEEFQPIDTVNLTAGLRRDDFDTFGRVTTGRLTAAWQVVPRMLKLRASAGTGFHAPSFLDLYGQSSFYVGNPGLKSERARGWDAGLDFYNQATNATMSLTWFQTNFSDLITGNFAVFPSTVQNVARARTQGIEWSLQQTTTKARGDWLDATYRIRYTYLDAKNLTSGTRLLRRPRHAGAADLWHDFGGGLSAGAGVTFAADRRDIDASTFAMIDAEDFTVVRLYGAWQVRPHLALKLRLENLLDEKYEPVNGYPATGFGAFAGLEWRW